MRTRAKARDYILAEMFEPKCSRGLQPAFFVADECRKIENVSHQKSQEKSHAETDKRKDRCDVRIDGDGNCKFRSRGRQPRRTAGSRQRCCRRTRRWSLCENEKR